MSDDQTDPIEPDAPTPPRSAPAYGGTLTYDEPAPVPSPVSAAVPWQEQRPRFVDQVLGMRAVIAVALACLIIGGLSGFVLGRASAGGGDSLGHGGPPGFQQQGVLPNGQNGIPNSPIGPDQPFGQGENRG